MSFDPHLHDVPLLFTDNLGTVRDVAGGTVGFADNLGNFTALDGSRGLISDRGGVELPSLSADYGPELIGEIGPSSGLLREPAVLLHRHERFENSLDSSKDPLRDGFSRRSRFDLDLPINHSRKSD